MLCSKTEFQQDGVYLTTTGVVVKRKGRKKPLFQGNDSVRFRIHSFGEKVKLSESIFSFDFELTSKRTTTMATLPFITFILDTSGTVDTTFTFFYKKMSIDKAKEVVDLYKKDLDKLKTDSTFYFNYDNQISQLLLAALNGNKEAETKLHNLEVPIKGVFKGKIISRQYTTKDLLQNSIRLINIKKKLP